MVTYVFTYLLLTYLLTYFGWQWPRRSRDSRCYARHVRCYLLNIRCARIVVLLPTADCIVATWTIYEATVYICVWLEKLIYIQLNFTCFRENKLWLVICNFKITHFKYFKYFKYICNCQLAYKNLKFPICLGRHIKMFCWWTLRYSVQQPKDFDQKNCYVHISKKYEIWT